MGFFSPQELSQSADMMARKKYIFWFRLLWIGIFLLFINETSPDIWGDLLLLGFCMLACHLILVIPSSFINPRALRTSFFVADFIFLLWGLLLTNLPFLIFALFLTAFFFIVFFSRSVQQLAAITIFYILLLPLSMSQNWIDVGQLFPESYGLIPIILFEVILLFAALYIGHLGIPINSQYAIQEKYRQSLARKNLAIRAGTDVARCSTANEIYHNVYDLLKDAVAGSSVEIFQVTGDRVSIKFSPESELTEDFSIDSSPALKQCAETALPVTTQHRRTGNWGDAYLEMYLPFHEEKGKDNSFFARVARHGHDFLEEERDTAVLITRTAGTHLNYMQEIESRQLTYERVSARLKILETDRAKSDLTASLITHIESADNVETVMNSLYEFSEKFLGADNVLLFRINEDETEFTLAGVRSKDPHRFQSGLSLPVAGSLMGRCYQKNSVSFRNSLKLSTKTTETPSDYPFYKQAGIASFILLPLRDPTNISNFGALVIASQHTEQFHLEQVEVIGQFSAELSKNLIFSFRFQQASRNLRRVEGIRILTENIVRLTDIDSMQRNLPAIIRDTFEFDFCDIYMYDPKEMHLSRPSTDDMMEEETRVNISVEDEEVYRQVFRTQQPHHSSRTRVDNSFDHSVPVREDRIVVPINYREDFLGLIDCSGHRSQAADKQETSLLELAADLIGWAIELNRGPQKAAEPVASESFETVRDLTELDTLEAVEESLVRDRMDLESDGGSPFPDISVKGQPLQLDPRELLADILGSTGMTGPHTIASLNAEISRFIEQGLDEVQIADLLYRLLSHVDYPDQKISTFHLVPDLVNRIGEGLGLPESKMHYLRISAKIYDIGKFAIPGDILYAPRELNEEERFEIQQHVNIGVQEILKNFKVFFPTLSIIKFHHERWNGTGYPWQLKEEEIPVESRILGLVDSFRALISDRPYRPRLPLKSAVDAVMLGKGELFDPEIVDLYLQILQRVKLS
jgi:hypothetical protein